MYLTCANCSLGTSWQLLARIWEEIADFILKLALWAASWQLLARIWEEIADFTLKLALWEACWQLLARFLGGNCRFYLKTCSLGNLLAAPGQVFW